MVAFLLSLISFYLARPDPYAVGIAEILQQCWTSEVLCPVASHHSQLEGGLLAPGCQGWWNRRQGQVPKD